MTFLKVSRFQANEYYSNVSELRLGVAKLSHITPDRNEGQTMSFAQVNLGKGKAHAVETVEVIIFYSFPSLLVHNPTHPSLLIQQMIK